jgi:hypothetical protein
MSRAKKKPELSDAVAPETQDLQQQPPAAPVQPRSNITLAHGQSPVTEGDLGWRAITLPAEAQQRAGWYEPQAAEILKLYGGIYKPVVDKGGN